MMDFAALNKLRADQRKAEAGHTRAVLAQIRELAQRVPSMRFQAWSYQRTVEYKNLCAELMRMSDPNAKKLPPLTTAQNKLREIEGYWR